MRSALFESDWGTVAVGLAVGSLMLVAALVALARPRGAWLRDRLDPYGRLEPGGGVASATVDGSPGWRPDTERLYGATERWLEGTRLWRSAMRLLERAGSQVRPVQFLYGCLLLGLGAGVLVAILTGSTLLALGTMPAAFAAAWVWTKRRARRRLRAFEEQLADILLSISSSLRVGLSFTHSLGAVVDDGRPPASEEFERMLNETELGRPMEDALAAMADRIESDDLRFVLMSVAIQREVGGSLADLFATVSETVRERQLFRRKVRALTAMGRMSAYLLIGLPFFVAAGISLLSPGYMAPLFSTTVGQVLIGVTLVMMVIGAAFLKKIVTIRG
jgi:tight adherence protein B